MNDYPPAVTTDPTAIAVAGKRRKMVALAYWIGVDETTAVGFTLVEGVPSAVGLVHYAPLTSATVREWQVRKMVTPEPWMPRFDDPQPPDPDELRHRWIQATRKTRSKVKVRATAGVGQAKLSREDYMDPDGFYEQVARFYQAFEATVGKPTANLAKAAGVTRNQAAQWVHQARRRGHLPPADRKGE